MGIKLVTVVTGILLCTLCLWLYCMAASPTTVLHHRFEMGKTAIPSDCRAACCNDTKCLAWVFVFGMVVSKACSNSGFIRQAIIYLVSHHNLRHKIRFLLHKIQFCYAKSGFWDALSYLCVRKCVKHAYYIAELLCRHSWMSPIRPLRDRTHIGWLNMLDNWHHIFYVGLLCIAA